MNDTTEWSRPYRQLVFAATCGIILIGAAFAAALFTISNPDLFIRVPAACHPDKIAKKVAENPRLPEICDRDSIALGRLFQFHATYYTVWATMLLTLPAFCTVWFIRRSAIAASYWLAFWTVGLVAMLVHLYMAMVLFEWQWHHALFDTQRVTIPIPDLALTLWWGIDVALGWWLLHHERWAWVDIQRWLVHVALLVVFLLGFIHEGDKSLSNGIGIFSALSVAVALVIGWRRAA